MCGTHKETDAARKDQEGFTALMQKEGETVFGAADKTFSALFAGYNKVFQQGSNQHGESANQINAQTSQVVTSAANESRMLGAAAKSGAAGYGGGNTLSGSGVSVNKNAAIQSAVAGQEAGQINAITQQDYAIGRQNWLAAGEGLGKAPAAYSESGVSAMNQNSQAGLKENMTNAIAADAASNWWVAPVEGAVGAGMSMMTGGLGGSLMGTGFGKGAGAALQGGGE